MPKIHIRHVYLMKVDILQKVIISVKTINRETSTWAEKDKPPAINKEANVLRQDMFNI